MKKMLLAAFACMLVCESAVSQTKPPDPEEFFTRLNALDDWFITMDGKEDNKAVVDRFMELFTPDAYLQVGPSKNQLGGVTYHGVEGIRKWADQFSKSYLDLNYRISFKTRDEKTAKPVYSFQMPWGEQGAAVAEPPALAAGRPPGPPGGAVRDPMDPERGARATVRPEAWAAARTEGRSAPRSCRARRA